MRRPPKSLDRLPASVAASLRSASNPASASTPALLTIPIPAAATKPYQPGGTSKSRNSRQSTSICRRGFANSLGSAISSAVMKTSRWSRSIHKVESRIPVSSFTNGIR